MEKKGNRNSPVARGAPGEPKKDGVSIRQWPRGGRRREPVGTNIPSKCENSRKPQPQQVKRPKPRSSYPVVDRNETSWVDDQLQPELGSVFLPGSKKQSLNHLLNFSYPPRENSYQPLTRKNAKGKLITTEKHKFKKEHYLQANCQFIVNESGDYRQYHLNPDALVEWDLVEQVNVQVTELSSCPICLYPPVAAKMTRCGHIYCWPCVLHYLAIADKPSQSKCPICDEVVQLKDLKSLVAILHPTFNVNETITFKLMKRLRGSLIAYPIDAGVVGDERLFSMSDDKYDNVYSKLVLANTNDIMSIIQREYKELKDYLSTDLDELEKSFAEQSLTLLKEREEEILGKLGYVEHNLNNQLVSKICDANVGIENGMHNLSINENGNKSVTDETMASGSSPLSKFHYFYQASDGQHIYLHAINARMLEHSYGSLQFCPKILTGNIIEKEGGSMNEERRRKLRYLQHLPLKCEFEVAEICLKPPVVTKETVDFFHDQLEARKKYRQQRAREEKRREKRIEAEQNRKYGKQSHYNLHLESNAQFPEVGLENRVRTESHRTGVNDCSSSADTRANDTSTYSGAASSFSGPSFATMLATEKKPIAVRQAVLTHTENMVPLKLINVTGSKMKPIRQVRTPSDNEEEPEGYEPVPSYSKLWGDALAHAFEQVDKVEEKTEQPSSGKKKKKAKQKVLFTTTMAYSGK